jgi:hypothetical protein
MNRRAIIDLLARQRSKGDEAERRRIEGDLWQLSTGLLVHLLNDEQLLKLREKNNEDQ